MHIQHSDNRLLTEQQALFVTTQIMARQKKKKNCRHDLGFMDALTQFKLFISIYLPVYY